MKTSLWIVTALGVGVVMFGCSKDGGGGTVSPPAPAAPAAPPTAAAPAPSLPSPEDMKQGVEIFSARCTPCHGPQGRGDGPASAALTPKPRNFTDPTWQAKVTDEHIERIILFGGAAVGKSPAMPANPDLEQHPGIIKGLRAHIRSLNSARASR